jgi:type III secretion protein Q
MAVQDFQPLALRRVPAAIADALTVIATRAADLPLIVPLPDGGSAQYTVSLTYGMSDGAHAAASLSADFESAGARFRLSIPQQACVSWLRHASSELDIGTLPAALAPIVLESMAASLAAAAGFAGTCLRAEPCMGEPASSAFPHAWTIRVTPERPGDAYYATLRTDELGASVLAETLRRLPDMQVRAAMDDLPIDVTLELGTTRLAAAELRTLAAGDLVLLDEYAVAQDGTAWLMAPDGRGLRVRQEAAGLVVVQGWSAPLRPGHPRFELRQSGSAAGATAATVMNGSGMENTAMDEDAMDADAMYKNAMDGYGLDATPDDPLFDADSISVRVTFDLGHRTVPLGVLRRLCPGEIVPLARPLSDRLVTVRANGMAIAAGSLVDIDGAIGVQIHALADEEATDGGEDVAT